MTSSGSPTADPSQEAAVGRRYSRFHSIVDPARHGRALRWWILALGTGAILFVYGMAIHAPAMGIYHDDGIYAVTARALAEGHGYRVTSLPHEIPQTKYPILFPLGLSAIWKIAPPFPANVVSLKLLPFAALLLWLAIVDPLLTYQTGRPRLAHAIVLLTAASPSVVRYTTVLLAETLFAAFAWAGLWVLIRCERESATSSRVVLAALLCAAAYHTRTVAFTLIAAGIVALAIKRKFRAALLFSALSGVLALPWLLWTWSQTGTIPEFYAYYTNLPYRDWNVLFGFTVSEKLTIVARNALFLLTAPGWLIGFHSPMLWPLVIVIGALVLMGFVMSLRRSFGVAHLFVALYVGTLLLWAWPPARFLVAVYPFLLFYAALGGLWALDRMRGVRVRTVLVKATVILVAFAAGWGSGSLAREAMEKQMACFACKREWNDFLLVMSWLEENTPTGAILMGTQDPMLYLYTGRKALRPYDVDPVLLHYSLDPDREPFGPSERLAERMLESGADYLILTRREESLEDDFLWRQFLELERERPRVLEPMMTIRSPDFGVYRINRQALLVP